jgi:hypothetical protein
VAHRTRSGLNHHGDDGEARKLLGATGKQPEASRLTSEQAQPAIILPVRPRGRLGAEAEADYRERVRTFCDHIVEINSSLDFKVSARGWCYLLEEHGLAKGDFDRGEKLINDCRKSGDLPLDICAEHAARATVGIEQITHLDIDAEIKSWIDYLRDDFSDNYTPISFWEDQKYYVEVGVEKLDLVGLFKPVCCEEFHAVPITPLGGWADINSRVAMMRRFQEHEAAGRKCVLLLCGDHDAGGLHQSEKMRENLEELSRAVGWSPDNLVIIRFGLNIDLIERLGLTWIDNLKTASGGDLADPGHPDHNKSYVQNYLAKFGARKVEANALVRRPDAARVLMRETLLQYISKASVRRYEQKLELLRNRFRRAIRKRIR